jgi:hypothetical protein
MIEIFTSKGTVRTDHDPETIAKLPKERQARYKKLIDAAVAAESCEAALKAATEKVHQAVKDHNAALEHRDHISPKLTHMDLWRAYKASA